MNARSEFFYMLGADIADAMEMVGTDATFADTEFDRFKAILAAGSASQMLEFLLDVHEENLEGHLNEMLEDAQIEAMTLKDDHDFDKDIYQVTDGVG